MESTIIETFSKSIEISVFPLRIKINIKLIPKALPKIEFKILVSPYTFGLSQAGRVFVLWTLRRCGQQLRIVPHAPSPDTAQQLAVW